MELFTHLVDDAAVFPPGLAPLDRAVAEHRVHQESWYAELIGPLLCRLREADQLRAIDLGTTQLQLVPIANSSDTLTGKVSAQVHGLAQLNVAGLELPPLPPKGPRDFLGLVADLDLPIWCEVALNRNWQHSLRAVRVHGFHAKLRTGGLEAKAFPTEEGIAAFVRECAAQGMTFKATAGLHHAIRHTAADTGFEHHGFLNLLCAVAEAQRGGDVTAALAERDTDVVVSAVRRLDPAKVRSTFHSFGCCGVTDPVDDLVALGLVSL